MADDDFAGCVRALLYPVQFEPDPMTGVDRVLEKVIGAGALGMTPPQYLEAIRRAIASDTNLAQLLPQPHPDAAVRRFLAELARRLEESS